MVAFRVSGLVPGCKPCRSFHERDLDVAAVVGFGAVQSAALEVAVRGMTSAAEREIGAAEATLGNAALVLADPRRPHSGSDELLQPSPEHITAGEIAVMWSSLIFRLSLISSLT